MSRCAEAWQEQQDDMQEINDAEECSYYQAVREVAEFIRNGAVSMEQFELNLREAINE